MPRVFSYGSLQQPAVQVATFGRVLKGSSDDVRRVRADRPCGAATNNSPT